MDVQSLGTWIGKTKTAIQRAARWPNQHLCRVASSHVVCSEDSHVPVERMEVLSGMLRQRHWPAEASDRTSVVWGKSVSVRVDLGGRRIIKKKKNASYQHTSNKKQEGRLKI